MTAEYCPVCDASPRVLVAVVHPAMRRMIVELLDREHGCWQTFVLDEDLRTAIRELVPDLLVVDEAAFPLCCCERSDDFPRAHVVVVGPEPDAAYMLAARENGAGGWVARDDVAEQLSAEMRTALGCIHEPCPPHDAVPQQRKSVEHHTLNP